MDRVWYPKGNCTKIGSERKSRKGSTAYVSTPSVTPSSIYDMVVAASVPVSIVAMYYYARHVYNYTMAILSGIIPFSGKHEMRAISSQQSSNL